MTNKKRCPKCKAEVVELTIRQDSIYWCENCKTQSHEAIDTHHDICKALWVEKKKVDTLVLEALNQYRDRDPKFASTCYDLACRGWSVIIDSPDYLHVEFTNKTEVHP